MREAERRRKSVRGALEAYEGGRSGARTVAVVRGLQGDDRWGPPVSEWERGRLDVGCWAVSCCPARQIGTWASARFFFVLCLFFFYFI